jgi:hypothetical protein
MPLEPLVRVVRHFSAASKASLFCHPCGSRDQECPPVSLVLQCGEYLASNLIGVIGTFTEVIVKASAIIPPAGPLK